ncbi:hypothetical protein C8F01DRAFT_1135143 [Mycena amicta]|nr:hypothetical protein C8F01DRAFT_1135143 [Mycena amicta]
MASSVETLLYTNAIPSDAESAHIRDFLAVATPQLQALEAEVSRLRELLTAATKQRDLQKELIEAHRALLSPVRRLPEDILRTIFVSTLPVDRDTAMCADEGPLLLAQICKFWRHVSLTTPRLWSSMHIAMPHPQKNHWQVEQLLVALSTWLQRSGAVPLSLTIAAPRSISHAFTSRSSQVFLSGKSDSVLRLLASVASRWQSIRFLPMANLSQMPHFSSLTADDVPLLQSIDLMITEAEYGGLWFSPAASCGNVALVGTPNLQSLSFYGGFDILLPHLTSWASLRRCFLRIPPQTLGTSVFPLEIMEKCSKLEYLDIVTGAIDTIIPKTSRAILLPDLKSLSVWGLPTLGWKQLFERVSFPALDSICILSAVMDLAWLIPFGRRITAIHLSAGGIVADSLVHTLENIPSLRELSLKDEPLVNDDDSEKDALFLQRFHPVGGNALCPRLERVRLLNFGSASDTTFVNFIRSRTANPGHSAIGEPIACFTHVDLAILGPPQELDIQAELAPQIARGLVLGVQYTAQATALTAAKYCPREGISQRSVLHDAFTFLSVGITWR